MASVDVQLNTVGDSAFSGSLSGRVHVGLVFSGDSAFTANASARVPVSLGLSANSVFTASVHSKDSDILGLVGNSAFTAAPSIAAHMRLNLSGDSYFQLVVLDRPPFVAGPPKQQAAANQFPGLRVGRLPPVRTSHPVVNPNPPRSLTPPEEPKR